MFIPYRKTKLTTTYSPGEVTALVSKAIQNPRLRIFSYSDPEPPLIGKMYGNSFSVRRAIQYKNSFLPRIKGSIEGAGSKTEITLQMVMHPIIIAFMAIWFGGLFFFLGIVISIDMSPHEGISDPALAYLSPVGMMLFGYCFMTFFFQKEADHAEEIIKHIIT